MTACSQVHAWLAINSCACLMQVMLALEEQQAQLAQDKEQLQQEVRGLRAQASSERQSQATRSAEAAVQAREAAASSALLASLAQTAQVPPGILPDLSADGGPEAGCSVACA